MSEASIRRLQRRFILISMTSLAIVIFIISGLMNIGNLLSSRTAIESLMSEICENRGVLPDVSENRQENEKSEERDAESRYTDTLHYDLLSIFGIERDTDALSPGYRDSTRFFAVLFHADGTLDEIKTSRISSIDEDAAVELAELAKNRGIRFGRSGAFYYKYHRYDDGSSIVIYMDCTAEIRAYLRVLYISLIIGFSSLLLAFPLVCFFSNRAVRPEIRNVERQRQFITNASHELKTPLSVIRANTELLELMEGENEWTESTLRQVDHMNDLIKNLVMLSRSEEMVDRSSMTEINVTDTISETVETFRPVAIQAGKTLTVSIRDEIRMITDRDMIEQLTSLLIDNAIKYCDDDGVVEVNASQKGRGLRLVVSNTYANGKGQDYSRFFDRFYRADASRSEQKKGYGIGLSIAQNIVQLNKGSINASWKDGVISFTCVIP